MKTTERKFIADSYDVPVKHINIPVNAEPVKKINPVEQVETETRGRKKKSNQLLELLANYKLSKYKNRYYLIDGNQALEIGSKDYKAFLSRIFYLVYKQALTESQITETTSIQRAMAVYEAPVIIIYIRVAAISETLIYIDLKDGNNTIMEVRPGKCQIAIEPDVLFFRPPNVEALPIPVFPGNFDLIKNLLNLKNEKDYILFRAAMVFMMRGRPGQRGSSIGLKITGIEGSAKSTAAKTIKYIIDPGTPEARTLGNDVRDLFIGLNNCYIMILDNLSHLSREIQDAISSIITGGGFARKLNYSDDEEIIFEICKSIILTAITLKLNPDFASRCINIELNPIDETERKTESEIWGNIEKQRPEILGGLLTMLSNALTEYEKGFEVPPLPRLADFAQFSIALERGNEWEQGQVIKALKESYDDALEGIADENPIINIILKKIQDSETKQLKGTAAELLEILNIEADEQIKADEQSKQLKYFNSWPKTAAGLGTILNRQYNVLKKSGVIVERGKGRERRKYILTLKIEENNEDSQINIPF